MQQVKGVQPLRKGINPATWMLEVSTLNKEHELGVDFADIYRRSDLYKCAPFRCKLHDCLGHECQQAQALVAAQIAWSVPVSRGHRS